MLLAVWLIIYLPALIYGYRDDTVIGALQKLICLTPMHLWYLVASFVEAIPFCLIRNRMFLWVTSAGLYTLGTITGRGYYWLLGGWPNYENFFSYKERCVFCSSYVLHRRISSAQRKEKYTNDAVNDRVTLDRNIGCGIASIAGRHVLTTTDCLLLDWKKCLVRRQKRACELGAPPRLRTGIYLMQFGIITVFAFVLRRFQLYPNSNLGGAIMYVGVVGGALMYFICRKLKLDRVLF